jgi:hypothetical protein
MALRKPMLCRSEVIVELGYTLSMGQRYKETYHKARPVRGCLRSPRLRRE